VLNEIPCKWRKRNKKSLLRGKVFTLFTNIYSGSTDNASELRVIGSLLLDEADSLAHYRIVKRGVPIEQLNIEGKRSGEGFCAHKAILVNALSRALAERVVLMDFTIGRKGFLTYLKSLGGSNVVKVSRLTAMPAGCGSLIKG